MARSAILFSDLDKIEQRSYQRVSVQLLGRYMLANNQEYPCKSVNMSPGGLLIDAPEKDEIGKTAIVYLDQIGRLEGKIAVIPKLVCYSTDCFRK